MNRYKNMKCGNCRHSNQGTMDARGGLVFCTRDFGVKSKDSLCSQTVSFSDGTTYYLFEKYETRGGDNCTWDTTIDIVVDPSKLIKYEPEV